MTHETTPPVTGLVDELLAELENQADEYDSIHAGEGDLLRSAAELIRQQQALIAQQAASVAVPDELRAKAEKFVISRRQAAELDRAAESELEDEDADEAQACAVQAYFHEEAATLVEQLLAAAPTQPAQQPVAFVSEETFSSDGTSDIITRNLPIGTPLYAAPPAQQSQWVPELFGIDRVPDDFRNQASGYRAGWNDCRAAMQAAPGGSAAPEQAGPRLAISSQEQLAALLNGVQALHEISAELIAECVFEQIRDATGETAAPGQAEPIPVAPERAEQPVRWGSAGTVGNLIAQLRTIDPGMPVYASLRIKNGVRDGVMLKGLVISYEHGDGRFIVRDGTERCVVIWTQPDDRHAEQDAEWVEKAMEQAQVFASAWSLVGGPFDTGDGLNQAKEEKELLRKLLEGGR